MNIFLLLLLLLGTSLSFEIKENKYEDPFPEPSSNEKVFKIDNIDNKTMLQLFFFKPTIVNQIDIYYYSNGIYLQQIHGWGYSYYNISTGLLFKSNYIKREEDLLKKTEDIILNRPLLLHNESILSAHVYMEKDVYFKYKVWYTNNTLYKWNDLLD